MTNEKPPQEVHTFSVTINDNKIEVDSMTFIIDVSRWENGSITITLNIPKGTGLNVDGFWEEADQDHDIRILYDGPNFITDDDQEFEVTITAEDIAEAKAIRNQWPLD